VPKRLLLLPCLLILSALVLSACGGGSSGGSSSGSSGSEAEADPASTEIEEVVKNSSTESDPANCTKLNTQKFDEQLVHEEGAGAVKGCESESESEAAPANSVTVTNIKVSGSKATLEAAFDGGLYGGQTVTVAMVKEGSQWKADQITKITKLDKAALEDTFKTQLEATGEISDKQVKCITDGIDGYSQAEVEKLLLSGSSQPFIDLATGCA